MRNAATLLLFAASLTTMCGLSASSVRGQEPPVQQYLTEGRLSDGATAMQTLLDQDADDQQALFSLGVVQFLQAIEGLGRDHYRYGLLGERRPRITFLRLPIPVNATPEQISYDKARSILQNLIARLDRAEQTLATMSPGNVKLPLNVGQIRFDFDADGQSTDTESLWSVMNALQRPRRQPQASATDGLQITFDAGDVYWLRGYCHALSGLAEIVLAYDWQDQFHRTAHLFYPNVDTPFRYLADEGPGMVGGFNSQNILDVVALIHCINYECTEPERMQSALEHFESVIALGRLSWKSIQAETDNDHEWIPNADQESAAGGMRIGREMISRWHDLLDEVEAILQGDRLVPFWRGVQGGVPLFVNSPRDIPTHPELGINVRKIFTNPQRFDLALWLQGTGLHPFLEKGERTKGETWVEIADAFGDEFFLFLFWFN